MGARSVITFIFVLLLTLEAIFCLEIPTNVRTRRKDKSSRNKSKSGIKQNLELDNPAVLDFPDVTYPTSIFEANEPYFYKSTYDDVLAPFPQDVQASYKSLSSNMKKNVNKVPRTVYEPKKDKVVPNVVPPSNDVEEHSNIQKEEDKIQSIETQTGVSLSESNETIQNVIIPKDTVFFDIIYKNGSSIENPIIELVPPSVPVRLKINIEICKDEEECCNESMIHLGGNDTIHIIEVEFVEIPNHNISDVEPVVEDHITVLDEINDDDFVNALSILLLDSLNNKPIEVPLPDILDIENSMNLNFPLSDTVKETNETEELVTLWTLELESLPLSLALSEEIFLIEELETDIEKNDIVSANCDNHSTNSTLAEQNLQLDEETDKLNKKNKS